MAWPEKKIRKRRGQYRVVVVPPRRVRRRLRRMARRVLEPLARQQAARAGVPTVAHGFVRGRSPVTAAKRHIGPWRVTVSLDLSAWFDSVTAAQVRAALAAAGADPALTERITHKGRAAQGLPTSPAAANLVAVEFDARLAARLRAALRCDFVATRYADDIAVSAMDDAADTVRAIIDAVATTAADMGWAISARKTCVYRARAGRRIVCGVAVDADGIHPTRHTRRRLRAAGHAEPDASSTDGLRAWARYCGGSVAPPEPAPDNSAPPPEPAPDNSAPPPEPAPDNSAPPAPEPEPWGPPRHPVDVASDRTTSPRRLSQLSRYGDPRVRAAVAKNPSTPAADRARLMTRFPVADAASACRAAVDDPDPSVRLSAASRADCPVDVRARLARDPDEDVWRAAISHARAGEDDVFRAAAASDDGAVRRAAAGHRHCPADVVARLARDPDHAVREAARKHPRCPAAERAVGILEEVE